jgi:hypothetical protein
MINNNNKATKPKKIERKKKQPATDIVRHAIYFKIKRFIELIVFSWRYDCTKEAV